MLKENPADTKAKEWMEIQRNLSEKRKFSDRLLLILLSMSIFLCGILIFALPEKSFSEEENRVLATFPSFSFSDFTDGSFNESLSEFYADQFPFRDTLVGIKAAVEISMGKKENNSVIMGKDGYLLARLEYGDREYENLKSNLDSIGIFADFCKKNNIKCDFAMMPRAIDVMASKLPAGFDKVLADDVYEFVSHEKNGTEILNFKELLKEKADKGEYVWYKTDHHYTTKGAYYVYCELGKTLGYTPKPFDFFEISTVSRDFLGTTYSKSGMKWSQKDEIEFYRFKGDENATVKDGNGDIVCKGFYDESYLLKKDKYSAFIGGNRGVTKVSLNDGDKPKLLMIKDSFSHAIAPFLAIHFDVELLDLRYFTNSAGRYALENNFDRVLIFYGIDSIASSKEACALAMLP